MALKDKVSEIFNEYAALLELKGENPFRVRAYRNAARSILDAPDLEASVKRGDDLTLIPGIGADLAAKIAVIQSTGTLPEIETLRAGFPPGMAELLHVPGLGPKRVKLLSEKLHIQNQEQLRAAAQAGKIRSVKGLGQALETQILAGTAATVAAPRRFLLSQARPIAQDFLTVLSKVPGVRRAAVAGSLRRCRESVGDLDLLVSAEGGSSGVMEAFVKAAGASVVLGSGDTKTTLRMKSGLQVDLRVVEDASFGAALHYFTGSQAHNIAIRGRARKMGLKVNEYGVYKGGRKIAGETEESVFAAVGLPWIPPELRENRGEIEAALRGALPSLVEREDLKGDLHCHTTATDGHYSIAQMAEAAGAQGLSYLAITDHSKRLAMVHGLDVARLKAQGREIDRLNRQRGRKLTLLKGVEVDILEDGTLDLPDKALAGLDIVVAAVHSKFDLPRRLQTERLLRALDNPLVCVLAHPTGRRLFGRKPYDVDLERVVRHAAAVGCALEINGSPDRLDLNDEGCRLAAAAGAMVSIDSDSHRLHEFRNLEFGVTQARRGWLDKTKVLNARTLPELRKTLRNK